MTFTKSEIIGYAIGELMCVAVMMMACFGLYGLATKYQKRCAQYEELLGIDPYDKYRQKFHENETESDTEET